MARIIDAVDYDFNSYDYNSRRSYSEEEVNRFAFEIDNIVRNRWMNIRIFINKLAQMNWISPLYVYNLPQEEKEVSKEKDIIAYYYNRK